MAMSEKLENFLVKLLHGAVLAVAAYSLLTIDFAGRGRLIDQIRGKKESPADVAALAAPTKANLQRADGRDRLIEVAPPAVVPEQIPAERQRSLTAAELAAQIPDVNGRTANGPKRLTTKLTSLDDPSRSASQTSAAGAESSPAYIEASAVAAPTAGGSDYSAAPPSQDEPRKARAVASRYGGSGRSDMMGNSAGPVYNINKKK